jgi:hypothetical protein
MPDKIKLQTLLLPHTSIASATNQTHGVGIDRERMDVRMTSEATWMSRFERTVKPSTMSPSQFSTMRSDKLKQL